MTQEIQTSTATVTATKSVRFTPEIEEQLKQQAMVLVDKVNSGLSAPEAAREVDTLGRTEQEKAAAQSNLLSKKLVDFGALKGEDSQMATDLVKFRETMDQLNPHRHQMSAGGRFLSRIPIVGPMILTAWSKSALGKIAANHQTIRQQVEATVNSLEANKDVIMQDNIELERLYGSLETTQVEVRRKVFIGEVLLAKLDEIAATADDDKKAKIGVVKSRVLRRMQNLSIMLETNAQAMTSANMTIENNNSLAETVNEMVDLGIPQLNTALMILSALASQRRAVEAVKGTQDYLGNLIVQNAQSLARNTEEIARLRNNPLLAMDKVRESHQIMMTLVDKLETMREEGDKTARLNIAELTRMSDQMQEQADRIKGSRQLGEAINEHDGSKQLLEGTKE